MTDPHPLITRTVSAKTPRDGRLELSDRVARELAGAASLRVTLGSQTATAELGRFACICRYDQSQSYLQSDLLKQLQPGTRVELAWDPVKDMVIVKTGR